VINLIAKAQTASGPAHEGQSQLCEGSYGDYAIGDPSDRDRGGFGEVYVNSYDLSVYQARIEYWVR